MRPKLLPICTAILLSSLSVNAIAESAKKNILMVLSSYGEKNEQGELIKPGYEFDEMSKSYLVFKAAGTKVTFASPKGGALITDNFDENKPYNKEFLADEEAAKQLANTNVLSEVDTQDYDAVYVVGGKGPMYDLATNQDVKRVIKQVYQQNGIVAAVCHGPAALLDVKLDDGSYLVNNKRISAFTNVEETAFTKKWQLPFSLEDNLKAQGANLIKDGLMLNQVSIDGQIVTGQNPFSTADSAIAVVQKLGLSTTGLPTFKDDNTIKLVEKFYQDRVLATKEYQANKQGYSPMLLAMSGLYQSKYATTEIERNVALALMELTQSDVNHPMLDAAIAQTHIDKSDLNKALTVLRQSQARFPDNEKIQSLLAEISKS